MENTPKCLQSTGVRGKLLTVQDGFLVCPTCRRNKRLLQVRPDTWAHNVIAYCRSCKTEHIVDIDKGQCYESRSQ